MGMQVKFVCGSMSEGEETKKKKEKKKELGDGCQCVKRVMTHTFRFLRTEPFPPVRTELDIACSLASFSGLLTFILDCQGETNIPQPPQYKQRRKNK
jgi:hypothetical protein